MEIPGLACASVTGSSITLQVCARGSFPLYGFTIDWMKRSDYAAVGNVWTAEACSATFYAEETENGWQGPGYVPQNNCSLTTIAPVITEGGLIESNWTADLSCDTEYVFRIRALGLGRQIIGSTYSTELFCKTLPCATSGCTYTIGYWKTHGPGAKGNNRNMWKLTSLSLGSVLYSDVQLMAIFNTSVKGNGLIALAHQLIGAKLNLANGSSSSAVASFIAQADALIGGLVVPPVGTGSLPTSVTSGLVTKLTQYNEGALGPGHCA